MAQVLMAATGAASLNSFGQNQSCHCSRSTSSNFATSTGSTSSMFPSSGSSPVARRGGGLRMLKGLEGMPTSAAQATTREIQQSGLAFWGRQGSRQSSGRNRNPVQVQCMLLGFPSFRSRRRLVSRPSEKESHLSSPLAGGFWPAQLSTSLKDASVSQSALSGAGSSSGAPNEGPGTFQTYNSSLGPEESVSSSISTDVQTVVLSPGNSSQEAAVVPTRTAESLQKRSTDAWQRIMAPLRNFGFGRRTVWEGGVGMFILSGIALSILMVAWIKNLVISSHFNPYTAVIEFGQACGITIGTPVRIRGIKVGSVVGVRPSLEQIDVLCEMSDATVIIPRNSRIEVNQSGLIAETLIDITPQTPIPEPKYGPLDKGCSDEGLIVCHREHIKGEQGVSLDELVSVCTKLMKEVDQNGTEKLFAIADKMGDAIKDAAPLLLQAEQVAAEIAPLLRELRDGEMFNRVEALFDVVTTTAADIRRLNKAVITDENTELLRQSVATLTKTLKHIESISKDVSQVTGDPKTSRNLRQLIQSLSRMVAD